MKRTYVIKLAEEERQHLEKIASSGTLPARTLKRAHILLKSDNGSQGLNWTYEQVRQAFDVIQVTITHVRKS